MFSSQKIRNWRYPVRKLWTNDIREHNSELTIYMNKFRISHTRSAKDRLRDPGRFYSVWIYNAKRRSSFCLEMLVSYIFPVTRLQCMSFLKWWINARVMIKELFQKRKKWMKSYGTVQLFYLTWILLFILALMKNEHSPARTVWFHATEMRPMYTNGSFTHRYIRE